MSKKEMDIEEMIADAKAEEEVAREQERAAKEEKAREDFRDTLRERLKEALIPKDESKVTISLSEYVILKQKETDLDRILNAIVDGLGLSYSKEYLSLKESENVVDAFRVLYPDVYDHLLAAELDRAEHEGE
jgi:acetyl-CoA carboxylase carboxyltransferase component